MKLSPKALGRLGGGITGLLNGLFGSGVWNLPRPMPPPLQ